MTAPANRVSARMSVLPGPELVSLSDGPAEPRTDVQSPWWEEYGGRLDPASGMVAFPSYELPPCPVPNCPDCARNREAR